MPLAVSANFTVTDAKGKSSTTKIHVPSGFVLPQYAEFGVAMGQLIANLNDGAITEVSVSVPVNLSTATIRATALGIADIAEKIFFSVRSSVTGLFARFFIPTYDEANTVTGSDSADIADPQIAAAVAILEDGILVGAEQINVVDLRGNDLSEVSEAREIFRKSG